jgi:hypothetical protein
VHPVSPAAVVYRPAVAPPVRVGASGRPAEFDSELPSWTKVCVALGVILVLLGFGGLAAAYFVS